MARWRLRDPGSFPPIFHEALARGPGRYLVAQSYTERGIKADHIEWKLFLFSLRSFPTNHLHNASQTLQLSARKNWNEERRLWELWVTVRPPIAQEFANIC